MKTALIVTYDLIRPGDPEISHATASLLASVRSDPRHGRQFFLWHESINLYQEPEITPEEIVARLRRSHNLREYHQIWLATAVWSEHLLRPTLRLLRSQGYRGLLGLGGYQITCTADPIAEEYRTIGRKNRPELIFAIMDELNAAGISHEVSLIYGLPGQTPTTFRSSIEQLQKHGCTHIQAWPLMLLKGTELHHKKEVYRMQEETFGPHQIPVVTGSHSFNRRDWFQMKELAESLSEARRHL